MAMKSNEVGRELGAIALGQGQRLGQLLSNALTWKLRETLPGDRPEAGFDELFYMSDEALLECAKAYARSKEHDGSPTT